MLSATFHSPKKGSVDTSLWIQTEQCLRTSAKGDNRSTHLHPNTLHYLLQAGRSHQKIWTLFIAKKICELIGGKKRGMLHTFKRLLWHMALPRVGCGASFVPRVFLPMKYCLIIWPKCRLFYLLLPSSLYRGLVNSCVSVWTHFVQPLQWRFLCTGPFWFCLRGGGACLLTYSFFLFPSFTGRGHPGQHLWWNRQLCHHRQRHHQGVSRAGAKGAAGCQAWRYKTCPPSQTHTHTHMRFIS